MGRPTAQSDVIAVMSDATQIDSGDLLDNVEHHFRVFAGPGAGKTFWLVRHIQNVLRRSTRLSATGRIGCISYTNVASEEIRRGLGVASDLVEIGTIHGFLYRHVVKPYLHLLRTSDLSPLVTFQLVKGHDEHHPSYQKVQKWLQSIGQSWVLRIEDQKKLLFDKLRQLVWEEGANGVWTIGPRKVAPMGPKLREVCNSDNLRIYKALYWHEGTIDHEDVLYFAHRIINEFDAAVQFLSARFRYLFIDEFQDTRPTQSRMIQRFAAHGTVVGVIGDEEQAIYGFQGAKPEHFRNYSLAGHRDYWIATNRRSTRSIVKLLNEVRTDQLKQSPHRPEEGIPPAILCGDIQWAMARVLSELPEGAKLTVLTRKNGEANRARSSASDDGNLLWEACANLDRDRTTFLQALLTGVEIGRNGHLSLAVNAVVRGITKRGVLREPLQADSDISELSCRGIAVELLEFGLNNYSTLSGGSLMAAYDSIDQHLTKESHTRLKRVQNKSKFRLFAESTSYHALASSVHPEEETRNVRTIHQAKSGEWANVMVWLPDHDRVRHFFEPGAGADGNAQEERRITYVALSRARDRLYVVVPDISDEFEAALGKRGVTIVRSETK